MRTAGALVALAAVAVVSDTPAAATQPAADLILRNGRFHTLDERQPHAAALALRAGRIVAVGSDTEVQAHAGAATRVIDLEGRAAFPGFRDAHAHVLDLGMLRLNVDLRDAVDFDEVIARIAAAARERPAGTWITGRGWHEGRWRRQPADAVRGFPVHTRLSAATPDHPVWLERADGHAALVNARAMRDAQFSGDSQAPVGGEIVRDAAGAPTGVLVDEAMRLVRPPAPSDELRQRALALAFEESLRLGVTSIDDAGTDDATVRLYRQLAAERRLPIRIYVMLSGAPGLRAVSKPEIGLGDGFLTIRAVKLYADGAFGSRGAALLEPYEDDRDNLGLVLTPPAELEATIRLAVERGFQVATHAIGDRGNRLVLDLYERALAAYPGGDRRLRIEHAQMLDAADIPRFARLGVIASMQTIHATSDRPWAADRVGMARLKEGAYAWRKLLSSGARIANGTDAPVEPLDPIANFHAAVTRQDARGQPPGGFDPEERMTRDEALRSLTLDAAYAAFQEHELGSLSVGKRADVVVLSTDIMQVPERSILDARVLYTIVDGRLSYDASAATSRPARPSKPRGL